MQEGPHSLLAEEGTVPVAVPRNYLVVLRTGLEVAYHIHHIDEEEIVPAVDLEVRTRLAVEDMEVADIGLAVAHILVVRTLAVLQAGHRNNWDYLVAVGMTLQKPQRRQESSEYGRRVSE